VEESEQLWLEVFHERHLQRKQQLQMQFKGKSKEVIPNREYFGEDIKVEESSEVGTKKSGLEATSEEKHMEKRSLDKDIEDEADTYNWVSNVVPDNLTAILTPVSFSTNFGQKIEVCLTKLSNVSNYFQGILTIHLAIVCKRIWSCRNASKLDRKRGTHFLQQIRNTSDVRKIMKKKIKRLSRG